MSLTATSSKRKKSRSERKSGEKSIIIVEVVEGRDLVAMDPEGTSDPYVIVSVGNKKCKTKVIRATLNPSWDIGSVPELFLFSRSKAEKSKDIVFKCMDWDRFKSDDRMGMVVIPAKTVIEQGDIDDWFTLKPQKSGDSVSGQLHLKLKLTNSKSKTGEHSKLWKAVETSDLLTVQSSLQSNDVDLNERGVHGETLLHTAVSLPSMEEDATSILMCLLKNPGTDVNLIDENGNTCLHAFCRHFRPPGCTEPFLEYIKKSAKVNAQNNFGETPLHLAMFNPSVKILMADLLIKNKADPNAAAQSQDTPLHYAVRIGRQDLVKLLIAAGADTEAAGQDGLRPYALAKKLQFENIADTLHDALDIIHWLRKYNLEKHAQSFLDQEIYLYILPDLNESQLARHVSNKEERKTILDAAKDIKILDRKETFQRKQQMFKKKDRLKKREDAVRQYLKQSIVVPETGDERDFPWEIDMEDIEFATSLGKGAFGEVFKGNYQLGKPIAIKVLKSTNSKKELEEFIKEFNILINVNSPHIVRFYGATIAPKLCMVMEFCERGSLFDVLKDETVDLDWVMSLRMIEEIVRGMLALHNNNPPILHRDLKTLNVLVTGDFHCRIADFGLSRFDTSTNLKTLQTLRGTYAYIAPEVYHGKKYIIQSDVYSIGIMIWEFMMRCVTGEYHRPYAEFPNIKADFTILVQAAKSQLRPTIHQQCPESYKKLITDCWNQEQLDRPDCEQLLTLLEAVHKDYNNHKATWDSLKQKKPRIERERSVKN